jgi:hypothetical protein
MNGMSHNVPNTLGVDDSDLAGKITALVPDYMGVDANRSMADMQMSMPMPENTLGMMSGEGPYGNIDMGGMFTVLKVREDLTPGDYRDPGWYHAPKGSVAWLWEGEPPPVSR